MTVNGEVQTREEATVYVKELDLLVTVVLFEETPAVLSLGKLCEDHGYTNHWTCGQQPHLTKKGQENLLQYIQRCTICGSWIICEFFLTYIFICPFIIFLTGVNIGEQRKQRC